MSNISPRAEPVAYATIVAAIVTAAVSYGFNITDELRDVLILIAPFAGAAIVARFAVWAPDSVESKVSDTYVDGFEHGRSNDPRIIAPIRYPGPAPESE